MPPDYWDSGVRKFGHYENDEEEWTPTRKEPWPEQSGRDPATAEPSIASEPVPGTSPQEAATVRLGSDRLPEEIRLLPSWRRAVDPDDYGRYLLESCQAARLREVLEDIKQGRETQDQPTMRQVNIALMKTRTIEEYRSTYNRLAGVHTAQGEGASRNEWGSSMVTVVGRRGGLVDVTIDSSWIAEAKDYEVQAEFLEAVAEVRRKLFSGLPDEGEYRLSDEELEVCVEQLQDRLLRASV